MSSTIRLLLVEDDARLASLIAEYLAPHGFTVWLESRGDRATGRILDERPDVVLLDVMLPGLDGLSICREVRGRYAGVIVMLTARGDEVDEVVGLEIGADDYMAKPVRPRVLLARLRTLLRRSFPAAPQQDEAKRISAGGLLIDSERRSVSLREQPVELTTAEFELLWMLAERQGRVVTRDEMFHALRGAEFDGFDRSIDLRISRLRKKLRDDSRAPRRIKSVRGMGYLLVDEP